MMSYIVFFVNNMTHKERLVISLSSYLKEKVESYSEKYGCSQAEVVRMALIRYLEDEQ
jgi:metal-responsive CopG/Arc/MetJ family transcriptional regulator